MCLGNKLGADACRAVILAAARLPRLANLNLWSNALGPDLVAVLPNLARCLTSLNLGCTYAAGACAAARMLTCAREICLSLKQTDNELGAEGGRALAAVLPQLCCLTYLNLRSSYSFTAERASQASSLSLQLLALSSCAGAQPTRWARKVGVPSLQCCRVCRRKFSCRWVTTSLTRMQNRTWRRS